MVFSAHKNCCSSSIHASIGGIPKTSPNDVTSIFGEDSESIWQILLSDGKDCFLYVLLSQWHLLQ